MALFKFHDDDIFINTIEAYPEFRFMVHSGAVVIDNVPDMAGTNLSNIHDVSDGHVSLYQRNIDKLAGQKQYAKVLKGGYRHSFKIYTEAQHNVWFNYDGEFITSSYNHSASISRNYFDSSSPANRLHLRAIKNSLNENKIFSPHYAYKNSARDLQTVDVNLISVPSIFYGQQIKKGTASLKFYITGSLVGELRDEKKNGELIQVGPEGSPHSGTVAGVVLYEQGVFVLTASHALNSDNVDYEGDGSANNKPQWTYFGAYMHSPASINSGNGIPATALESSFTIDYQGITQKQTMTMMAHARAGDINHSNNPTYKDTSHPNVGTYKSSIFQYIEPQVPIKNITHTPLTDQVPQFQKETYITKVALYDEKKNLIGVAKVAVPVRKTEQRQFTFKLKLDI